MKKTKKVKVKKEKTETCIICLDKSYARLCEICQSQIDRLKEIDDDLLWTYQNLELSEDKLVHFIDKQHVQEYLQLLYSWQLGCYHRLRDQFNYVRARTKSSSACESKI